MDRKPITLLNGNKHMLKIILFLSVRGSLGCNDNPTAVQFRSSYKKLLLGGKGDVHVDKFNVMLEDDVHVVDLFKTIEKTKCDTANDFNFDLGLSRFS